MLLLLQKNKAFENVSLGRLQEKKRKRPNFEFDTLTTTVRNILTYAQHKKTDSYQLKLSGSVLLLSRSQP